MTSHRNHPHVHLLRHTQVKAQNPRVVLNVTNTQGQSAEGPLRGQGGHQVEGWDPMPGPKVWRPFLHAHRGEQVQETGHWGGRCRLSFCLWWSHLQEPDAPPPRSIVC